MLAYTVELPTNRLSVASENEERCTQCQGSLQNEKADLSDQKEVDQETLFNRLIESEKESTTKKKFGRNRNLDIIKALRNAKTMAKNIHRLDQRYPQLAQTSASKSAVPRSTHYSREVVCNTEMGSLAS